MKPAVIVTGAAGGVGMALVGKLSRADKRVIAMVLDEREAERLRRAEPKVADVIRCDLSNADKVGPALSVVLSDDSLVLEAVVACAGVWPGAPLETMRLEEARRTLEINAIAPLALLQATLPALRRSRGRVVFVSSISGRLAMPFNAAYGMSKFALEAVADVARREAARWGIHVTVVQPGPINTPMVTGMLEHIAAVRDKLPLKERELYGWLYTGFAEMCEKGLPDALPAQEVANAVVDVLAASEPQTRVQVGPIAKQICDAARSLPDRDLDALAQSLITGAIFAQK
jgi:NAD(P)-dependent dehydrogenase (short-subunit alcohol dehydrogenase family)